VWVEVGLHRGPRVRHLRVAAAARHAVDRSRAQLRSHTLRAPGRRTSHGVGDPGSTVRCRLPWAGHDDVGIRRAGHSPTCYRAFASQLITFQIGSDVCCRTSASYSEILTRPSCRFRRSRTRWSMAPARLEARQSTGEAYGRYVSMRVGPTAHEQPHNPARVQHRYIQISVADAIPRQCRRTADASISGGRRGLCEQAAARPRRAARRRRR